MMEAYLVSARLEGQDVPIRIFPRMKEAEDYVAQLTIDELHTEMAYTFWGIHLDANRPVSVWIVGFKDGVPNLTDGSRLITQ